METTRSKGEKRPRKHPEPESTSKSGKLPFDIDVVMNRVREAVAGYPKAALFQLADEGYQSVFEQLVACVISIRTLDEVTVPVAKRLFEVARTPGEVSRLKAEEIDRLIGVSTFH